MKIQLPTITNSNNQNPQPPKVERPWRVVSTLDVLARLSREGKIDHHDFNAIAYNTFSVKDAQVLSEAIAGTISTPFSLNDHLIINGKHYTVPMATEEASIVAANIKACVLSQPIGFTAVEPKPLMTFQVQVINAKNKNAAADILRKKREIFEICNSVSKTITSLGGGAKALKVKKLRTKSGENIITYVTVDVRDAMGANTLNTMAERITPLLEQTTQGTVVLRILSNFCEDRIAKARVEYDLKNQICKVNPEKFLAAQHLAEADTYRAVTHNKGIMNGIDAVLQATGNDFRAVEAAAHAHAWKSGKCKPLTTWKILKGKLIGEIQLPVPVGIIGGATKTNSTARSAMKILNVKTAGEFGTVLAAVGLAQNFAALNALSSVGIQQGHMGLHAKNIALQAGAKHDEIELIVEKMRAAKQMTKEYAHKIIQEIRRKE